jgi:stage II sporulation protein P
MGKHLSEQLNALGVETLHHTGVYDLINGKLDRSKAYQQAEVGVKEILNQYPSIEVVIDLHRDGVPETTHLVTEIEGKQVAKIMYFNGLCRTKSNGDLTSMPNPYIQDNLAMTLQLKLMSEQYYPGLARNIYLKSLRYNLHLSDKALLIEVGAQTNTLQEMINTMEPLSDVLDKVFDP